MEILTDNTEKKIMLLANEAVVRGALEAGVGVATTYPGTPASEIGDAFSKIAIHRRRNNQEPGFYFEYSVNEKVALEIGAAASLCGLRAITSMKCAGLNVASDALISYAYIGSKGGHVIVFADDPYAISSQTEQDSRYFAFMAGVPMLEPSNPQEAKDMTLKAFKLSEELKTPILLRLTTRTAHVSGPVSLGATPKQQRVGRFVKDKSYADAAFFSVKQHKELLRRLKEAEVISENSPFNRIYETGASSETGVVTLGAAYNYVLETAETLGLNMRILKLGMTHPLPEKLCARLMSSCRRVIIAEELEPIVERQIKSLAHGLSWKGDIYGKLSGHFPRHGEYTPDLVKQTFSRILRTERKHGGDVSFAAGETPPLPARLSNFCPGCPHRATYYAAKTASPPNTVYAGDIGCYTIGHFPPLNMNDVMFCMGSGAGIASGVSVSTKQKVISFMGDSTFFHSGIPPVLNAIHHNHDALFAILDNQTTAMTGMQPHPGIDHDGMGLPAKAIKIEDVVKGLGAEHIEVVDPSEIQKTTDAFKRALDFKGAAVVVSRSPCMLLELKKKARVGLKKRVCLVDAEKCEACGACVAEFGCAALCQGDDGGAKINSAECAGCGHCAQICPAGAISK